MKKGLLETEKGYLRFTEKGIDISNTVLAEFV
jgi:coproporphyrinogen III oxidase-like Fe-S oxidoreductase